VDQCERGDLALAWVPPIATAKLQASGAVTVLALPLRRGAVAYRSALVTQEDGPASLADVQGATVGWVDRESCSGYVMPRLFLAASAFDLDRLFSREVFLGSHSAVVEAVMTKRVVVGATFCSLDTPSRERRSVPPAARAVPTDSVRPPAPGAGAEGSIPPQLRILAATGPIPNDAIVVSSRLPIDLRSKLLRWFLDLRDERAKKHCAELFGASSFRVAADEHFAALQQMMWAARMHGVVA
jgi:phosphonate transport system substrate-binding protein